MKKETSLEDLTPDQRDELAATARMVAENPKTRSIFQRLIKQVAPGTPIPELDIQDNVKAAMKPLQDQIAALSQEKLERDVETRVNNKRQTLRDQGYSKEDIEAVEEIMVKEGIPKHETAAEYLRMQRQTATPTPASYNHVRQPVVDKDAVKAAGNIKNWANQEAHQAVDDIKAGRIKLQ